MDLKYQKPSAGWITRISDEGLFTQSRVNATDKILDTFLDNLSISKDNTDIWKSIEKVVKALNKLNKSEEYFIDLPEREALVDYIQTEAEKAGLKFAGDVTEEWRDEW